MVNKYVKRKPPQRGFTLQDVMEISAESQVPQVLIAALANRGFSPMEARDILLNDYPARELTEKTLNGAEAAADEILNHIKKGDAIGIFADYDCDGVTSGFVMYEGLNEIIKHLDSVSKVGVYYPQRSEGYGLNMDYCQKAVEHKVGLVVTVDNGITVKEQCNFLKKHGINLVVTDHHEPIKAKLPNCTIVDPCFSDIGRSYMAGVAVAFNVIQTMANKVNCKLDTGRLYPAVAIGTISDCMPMCYENSAYVKIGLGLINNGEAGKFLSMLKGDNPLSYTPTDISFSIAPLINAASRMGDTRMGAAGFLTDDDDKISAVIRNLQELNKNRKEITDNAREVVSHIEPGDNRIVCFNGADYGKGIHGIIAGEISKRFPDYPAFVYNVKPVDGKGLVAGSIRCANPGINCIDMFDQLKKRGIVRMAAGHASACVLEVDADKMDTFISEFNSMYDNMEIPPTVKELDASITIKEATNNQTLIALNKIPFTAQEEPLFGISNVMVNEVYASKNNPENVRFTLADSTGYKQAWAWKFASRYKELGEPTEVHLVCTITQDFMNKRSPKATIKIVDMIPVKRPA